MSSTVITDGVNQFGGEILNAISNTDDDSVSADSTLRDTSTKQMMALSMGIPAQLMCVLLIRPLGVKKMQVLGFLMIAVFFLLLAVLFEPLHRSSPAALFALYCLLLFQLTGATNVSTFVLPATMYDKDVRSSLNGVSAACGKLGAAVGCYLFGSVSSFGVVMGTCAVLALAGGCLSEVLIPVSAAEAEVQAAVREQEQLEEDIRNCEDVENIIRNLDPPPEDCNFSDSSHSTTTSSSSPRY